MRRDDVERALDVLASEVPAPTANSAALMTRGRRRVVRQRVMIIGVAAAAIATAAGVGAVANNDDARRVVAPVPTTLPPSRTGPASEIAVASSLEAWKCLNPLQYTDNGGRTWESIALPKGVPPDATSCTAVSGGNAWVIWSDREFHVLRIRGGAEPEVFAFPQLPESIIVGPLTFVDRDYGWVQTYNSESAPVDLYRTLDGGATWKVATTDIGGGPFAFADAHRGWSSDGSNVSYTEDGGVAWRGVDLPKPAAPASGLALFQIRAHARSIVVWRGTPISGVRSRPFFDVSTDGGHTWALRAGPDGFEVPGVTSNAFDAVDGSHWALTSGNALRITDDGGRTWQVRPNVPNVRDIRSIAFPTPDVGWITTESGMIVRTTDSGRTWTDVTNGAAPEPSTSAVPSQLAFASDSEGWICGKQPTYTTDDFDYSGAGTKSVTIAEATSPQNTEVSAQQPLCATLPGGNLWLVRGSSHQYESEIVRIQSGGTETSVIRFAPKPFGRIVSLDFVDAEHGWALVQRDGATPHDSYVTNDLYSTGDGGVNWSRLLADAPIAAPLDFTSTTSGWASARENGSLKTTDDAGITWHGVNVPTKTAPGSSTRVWPVFARDDVVVAQGTTSTGNFDQPFFAVSTDRGATWALRAGPSVSVQRTGEASAFGAADADHWAVGARNRLFVTDDGGGTWTEKQQFAGVRGIWYVARPSVNAMLVSGYGDARQTSTVVLGTTDAGASWRIVDVSAPPMRSDASRVNFPGGIVGCPTRTVTPAEPGNPPPGVVAAAFAYIRAQGFWEPDAVSAVYKVGNLGGVFGELFNFHLRSCPKDAVANSWVVELHGKSGSGGGGSTPRAELALAHYADGWHVFGRYH
jgi:photosystem II stability/assembly factor-like uncharacterized protein